MSSDRTLKRLLTAIFEVDSEAEGGSLADAVKALEVIERVLIPSYGERPAIMEVRDRLRAIRTRLVKAQERRADMGYPYAIGCDEAQAEAALNLLRQAQEEIRRVA